MYNPPVRSPSSFSEPSNLKSRLRDHKTLLTRRLRVILQLPSSRTKLFSEENCGLVRGMIKVTRRRLNLRTLLLLLARLLWETNIRESIREFAKYAFKMLRERRLNSAIPINFLQLIQTKPHWNNELE